MARKVKELSPKDLRLYINPNKLGFETTEELDLKEAEIVAQDRAVNALKFGLGIPDAEYNIYVAGPPKTGLSYITKLLVEKKAKTDPPPMDWCYVYNFRDPDHPRILGLKKGQGIELKKDMNELIEDVQKEIPEVFESEDYSNRKDEIIKKFNAERHKILSELEERVNQEGFVLNMSQVGMVVIPAKEGKPMDEEMVKALSEEEREELRKKSEQLQVEMNNAVRKIRKMEKSLKEKLRDLDKRVALYAVGYLIDDLQEKYEDNKDVLHYLKEVKDDIITNIEDFKSRPQQSPMPFPTPPTEDKFIKYRVNVFIDNSQVEGAPVVVESNPSYTNLFGTIERKAQFGALVTDFTMIRPGSVHKANGGYLIIRILDLLKWYFSYEALKRAIKNREAVIEDMAEQLGLISTKGLKPQAVPLKLKVILIGDPLYYYLLFTYDEEFSKLFKIKAHLDTSVTRDNKNLKQYTSFICRTCKECNLLPVHKTGVARLIEYACELTGDKQKLTLQLEAMQDLLREADFFAKQDGADKILDKHVEYAIEQKIYRSNLYEEKIQEAIERDILHIDVDNYVVGQVNGLSVYDLGDYAFGRPSRITATISLGKEGVIDIEREAKLSGKIHTKGVMILSRYLKSKYSHNKPLTLSASLTFEQSYGFVEGDSASSAELFALMSALSEVPIYQGIAVTGSVSQKGEIQPIGGVNEKIDGFFRVCLAKGLTGKQGVIIPKANVDNLMLKKDVIEAVKKGKFHIWAISDIEEGMEILTGKKMGRLKKDGTYTKGSINDLIDKKLKELTKIAKEYGKDEKEK